MARTVSDLIDRLAILAHEQGEANTPVLIEGPDGALYPLADLVADDLAVVVTVEDTMPAGPSLDVPPAGARASAEVFLASLLRDSVADNPFAGEPNEAELAPAFIALIRGVVRMTRAGMESEGPAAGLEGVAAILEALGATLRAHAAPITVEDFARILAEAPTAEGRS